MLALHCCAAAGTYNADIGGTSLLDCSPSPRGTYTPIQGASSVVVCSTGASLGALFCCAHALAVPDAVIRCVPPSTIALATGIPSHRHTFRLCIAAQAITSRRKAKRSAKHVPRGTINRSEARPSASHVRQAAIRSLVRQNAASAPSITTARLPTHLRPSAQFAMRFRA